MLALGIETSCDETAAALVRDGLEVVAGVVHSQDELHCRFGGVVPELAGRAHVEKIDAVLRAALDKAGLGRADLDCVAVTNRPGLVGSLVVGLTAAKMLALAWNLPLVGVNHIHAHLYAARMAEPDFEYPAAGLVVSGGHTALYAARDAMTYEYLGGTIDDAAGETFDKVAALLRLGYPGGPRIDKLAKAGNRDAVTFPRSFLQDASDLQFSFSGLKTSVLYAAMGEYGPRNDAALDAIPDERKADLAASFQEALVDVLVVKLLRAARKIGAKTAVIGGGVACNSRLRERLREDGAAAGLRVVIPPPAHCTDNAVMIAGLGGALFAAGHRDDLATLDAMPKMNG